MITALMLIMVVATLSILVLGTLVSQVRPASLVQKTTRTIFAAETGTQVALGELRTTLAAPDTNSDIYGDPTRLPCSLSGAVDGDSSQLRYAVTVQYFTVDPSRLTTEERSQQKQQCGVNAGRGVAVVPAYAVITSQGLAAGVPGLATTSGDRTLETQYAFRRTNKNVPGGLFRTSDLAYCLTANSATAESEVTYRAACARSDLNSWVHTETSTIALASTVRAGAPLCLQGPAASDTVHLVKLAPCAVVGRQLFSYKGYFQYRGQTDDNGGVGAGCLWAGVKESALKGAKLHSSSGGCVGGSNESLARRWWSWNPEPAVGAGSASLATSKQFINYQEFGRCFEVTQENLSADRMGIGPCKQELPGNSNRWNQVWAHSEPAPAPRR